VACTINKGVDEAHQLMEDLARVGVNMADVSRVLEEEGVASFSKSFDELMATLNDKAAELTATS
jgi:transaldolase